MEYYYLCLGLFYDANALDMQVDAQTVACFVHNNSGYIYGILLCFRLSYDANALDMQVVANCLPSNG